MAAKKKYEPTNKIWEKEIQNERKKATGNLISRENHMEVILTSPRWKKRIVCSIKHHRCFNLKVMNQLVEMPPINQWIHHNVALSFFNKVLVSHFSFVRLLAVKISSNSDFVATHVGPIEEMWPWPGQWETPMHQSSPNNTNSPSFFFLFYF